MKVRHLIRDTYAATIDSADEATRHAIDKGTSGATYDATDWAAFLVTRVATRDATCAAVSDAIKEMVR